MGLKRYFKPSKVYVQTIAPDGQTSQSTIEDDFFALMAFRRDVEAFGRPDETVRYMDTKGKLHSYNPDALVTFKPTEELPDGLKVLVELKPDFTGDPFNPRTLLGPPKGTDEDDERRWEAARTFAVQKGWIFKVYRESEIRTPFLKNVKFLDRYMRHPVKDADRDRLLALLRTHGKLSLNTLMALAEPELENRAKLYPSCYALICSREIAVDLEALLTLDSVLSLPQ